MNKFEIAGTSYIDHTNMGNIYLIMHSDDKEIEIASHDVKQIQFHGMMNIWNCILDKY